MSDKLDKDFIEKMKEKLLKEKDEIETELALFTDKGEGEGNYDSRHENIGAQDEDNATEVADYTDKKALAEGFEENLSKINKALKRIEDGNYGFCAKCNKNIPKNRLEAFPAAETCVDC